MTWALHHAPVSDPTSALVLVALADRAHDDGQCAWPSQPWIAERARVSVRTVRRTLDALETAGLIRRGDQRHVAHLAADRRPVVWNLQIARVREEGDRTCAAPRGGKRPDAHVPPDADDRADAHVPNGRTPTSKRADAHVRTDRTPTSYEPSLNRPEPSLNRPPRVEVATVAPAAPTDSEPGDFDRWYDAYGHKRGRAAAQRAYAKARKSATAQQLLDAIPAYRASKRVRDGYVKDPATWLNGACWDDVHEPYVNPKDAAWQRNLDRIAELQAEEAGHDRPLAITDDPWRI